MTPSPARGLLRTIIDDELALAADRIERRFLAAMAGGVEQVAAVPSTDPATGLPASVLARMPVRLRGDAEARIYALLRAGDVLTAGEIGKRLGNVKRQMVSKATKRLIEAGAIEAVRVKGKPSNLPSYRVRP